MSATDRVSAAAAGETITSGLAMLRRRWLVVVVAILACVAAAVVRHEHAAKAYKSTASVSFQSGTLSDSALQVTPTGSGEPQREANTELLTAHSSEVAAAVRQQIGSTASAGELLEEVSAQVAPSANVLEITASTTDPAYSARLANAFAEQYIAFRAKAELSGIATAESRLQSQVATLPEGSAERATLQQSLQRLSELKAVAGGGATIISRATPPNAPSGSGTAATAAIGLVIGIAVAFAFVFLVESLDRRIRKIDEFERDYGLQALAAVPKAAFRGARGRRRGEVLEPYRMLRSALEFTAVTRDLNTLLITSAISEEGKTTVAVDLARTVALTGRKVVLLELDLRRPSLAEHFQLDSGGGVTTVLTGAAHLSEMLVSPVSGLPQLRVLPAGRLPHNPAELLGSNRMTEILAELSATGVMVIIDSAPLNLVADTQVLLNNGAIDGALIVARVGRTSRDDVRRARAILSRHAVEPVGLVVTGIHEERAYDYKPYRADGGPAVDSVIPALSPPGETIDSERQARR